MPFVAQVEPARLAWLDLGAGVAGDMLLAALLDAGADFGFVCRAVDSVIPGAVRLETSEVRRAGLRALALRVEPIASDQPHRTWASIRSLLAGATDLDDRVRTAALEVFAVLAEAEAGVHGVPVDDVHFHEVGAWDAIADIVGCCAARVWLGLDELVAGPVELGSGSVRTRHGLMPVPVPAVAELLDGWIVTAERQGECATPTGAAIIRGGARQEPVMPRMRLARTGVGAGARETPDRANVVRVLLGTAEREGTAPERHLELIETNVDDLDPRLWPGVLAAALAAGSLDAWLTPIVMKKGRPAHTFSALCPPDKTAEIAALVIDHTSTLGVRVTQVRRPELERRWREVAVEGVGVRIKVGLRSGRIVHAAPEFADVEAAAAALGRTPAELLDAARVAARDAGIVPGAPLSP